MMQRSDRWACSLTSLAPQGSRARLESARRAVGEKAILKGASLHGQVPTSEFLPECFIRARYRHDFIEPYRVSLQSCLTLPLIALPLGLRPFLRRAHPLPLKLGRKYDAVSAVVPAQPSATGPP